MIPHRVILCLRGGVGGVDVFGTNFVRELCDRGIDARVVLTTRTRSFLPADLPIDELPIRNEDSWPRRWQKMIDYLERQTPCVFIPNYQYNYSCISPKLSEKVIIVGIVHSDESVYYEDLMRVGRYCNGIVSVSQAITNHIAGLSKHFSRPVDTIPYGVDAPTELPERQLSADAPLRIVFVGRLVTLQKRVLDLAEILQRLHQNDVPFEITIIGDGSDRAELLKRCEPLSKTGRLHYLGVLSNDKVLQNLKTQDAIILTSDYEGLSIALLEAMSYGCVPIVTDIRSGIPELIENGLNGFTVRIGAIDEFVNALTLLQRDIQLRKRISRSAFETIRDRFNVKKMTTRYVEFFERLSEEVERGLYHRPEGSIIPPPELKLSWKQHLPAPVRSVGTSVRNLLRRKKRKNSA
jgi:glycosyltransferase involved in cell wall biosynthesis